MATFKYFSDRDGITIQLAGLSQMDNAEFVRRFPGIKGMRVDGFSMRVGYAAGPGNAARGMELPMTRAIKMKRFPTRHECSAKCLHGKRNSACECQCGGRNHGRGMFSRLLKAP